MQINFIFIWTYTIAFRFIPLPSGLYHCLQAYTIAFGAGDVAGDVFIVQINKIHCGIIAINQAMAWLPEVHNLFKRKAHKIKIKAFIINQVMP